MNVKEVQQHVTHFSAQLKQNSHHQQEVSVGGEIISIIPSLDEILPMYVLMLDNHLGVNYVYVTPQLMKNYQGHFQIGKYVFVEGFVNVITRKVKKEIKKDISIFAYSVKDISKREEFQI